MKIVTDWLFQTSMQIYEIMKLADPLKITIPLKPEFMVGWGGRYLLLLAKHYNPLDWGQKQFEQVGQILGKKDMVGK